MGQFGFLVLDGRTGHVLYTGDVNYYRILMKIEFVIKTASYLVARFEVNEKVTEVGHSFMYGDKFQHLLNGFFLLYNFRKENENNFFPFSYECIWHDDRVNYRWAIKADDLKSDILIEIFELSPSNPDYKIELVKAYIQFDELSKNLYRSLALMLDDFGLIGYKKAMDTGNFPIYEYLTLKADVYNVAMQKTDVSADDEWKEKIFLRQECSLLLHNTESNL